MGIGFYPGELAGRNRIEASMAELVGRFRLLVGRVRRVVVGWPWPKRGPPLWDEMDCCFCEY